MLQNENYQRHMAIGLILTLILWAGLTFYWIGESNRLAHAAEHLAQERVELGEKIYEEQCVSCHGAHGEGGVGTALNNKGLLKKILKQSVNKSFNLISVDNCMSTSDCVLALANGMSGLRVAGYGLREFV